MNILVTGGASGLGEAIVKRLALISENKIFFTYAKSIDKARVITAAFLNTEAIHCDFRDTNSMKNLVNLLPSLDLDVVVNNAVTSLNKNHFHKIESHDFLLSFQNNILPTLQITQECIKIFRKKKFGKIINIASSYVINKPPMGLSEYVANKAYLISMSNSWAIENIRFNITSNSISPTYMQTQFTSETDERIVEEMIKNHALKKLLTTEEVADSVLYFVNCTQHINGVNLLINAGDDLV